jgi:hypothetical protein
MKRIYRTKKGKDSDTYTIISNQLLNSSLSADAIYVLVQVLKKPNYWKFYINKFSLEIKFGERRLRTAITELIENGYCNKIKISKREVDYTFFESNNLNPEFNIKKDTSSNENKIQNELQNERVSIAKCSSDLNDLQY